MENVLFIIIDIIAFAVLNIGLGVHWIVAFFLSTAITWLGFYLVYLVHGYVNN